MSFPAPSRHRAFAVASLLAASVAVAVVPFAWWHLRRTGIWFDEAMQFWMSWGASPFKEPFSPRGGILDSAAQNAGFNLDPGGFTLGLRFWMQLGGESMIWLRSLPLAFFIAGMAGLGALAWTWRPSVLFAAFGALVPACYALLLDYATEIRAYAMEFAGVTIGCLAIARLLAYPRVATALAAGLVLGLFLSSRYSYVLFAAAACAALALTAMRDKASGCPWRGEFIRAFAAPFAALGALAGIVAGVQFYVRLSPDAVAYFARWTAAGKTASDLALQALANLAHPAGLPLTLLALVGIVALLPKDWRLRLPRELTSGDVQAFGMIALVTLVATMLVWPWHPWDMDWKWSLYLHALSAVALVRIAATGLALAGARAGAGAERSRWAAVLLLAGVLVLDLRLATHRRPEGNTLAPALDYLERHADPAERIAVNVHWYPPLRYFYEHGAFRGSRLYPEAFIRAEESAPAAAFGAATRYLISYRTIDKLREVWPGIEISADARLPAQLFRVGGAP